MITVKHFENGDKTFETEKEFISFVQMIFTENGDEEHMPMPQDAQQCAKYVANFCGNFQMVYYQPELVGNEWVIHDFYSFEVYLHLENAKKDFPNHRIDLYTDNDIEEFSVVDYTESYVSEYDDEPNYDDTYVLYVMDGNDKLEEDFTTDNIIDQAIDSYRSDSLGGLLKQVIDALNKDELSDQNWYFLYDEVNGVHLTDIPNVNSLI
jgi:hypothetical protein